MLKRPDGLEPLHSAVQFHVPVTLVEAPAARGAAFELVAEKVQGPPGPSILPSIRRAPPLRSTPPDQRCSPTPGIARRNSTRRPCCWPSIVPVSAVFVFENEPAKAPPPR